MFQGRRPRSLTPPAYHPRPAILHGDFKPAALRSYSSAEALHTSHSSSSSPEGQRPLTPDAARAGPAGPVSTEDKAAMFSTFFTHTRSQKSVPNVEMDKNMGDFNQTPPPSARPSLSLLRSQDGGGDVDSPVSGMKDGAPWHHLLKTSIGGTPVADNPAPPVLSQTSKIKTPDPPSPVQEPLSDHETKHSTPSRHSSVALPAAIEVPSPVNLPENRGVSPSIPLVDRVCADPALLHPDETHAHAHHPGLLRGADFCDAGEGTRTAYRVLTPSSLSSPSSDDFSVRSGFIYRAMPNGELAATDIRVAIPRHEGHSRAVKVRPFLDYYPNRRPSTPEEGRHVDPECFPSKVRPFDPEAEGPIHPVPSSEDHVQPTSSLAGMTPEISTSGPISEESASRGSDRPPFNTIPSFPCHQESSPTDEEYFTPARSPMPSEHDIVVPVSKVRAVEPVLEPETDTRDQHRHISKVRPFDDVFKEPPMDSDACGHGQTLFESEEEATFNNPTPRCSVSSFSTIGSHKGHHHLPKVQAYSDRSRPSGFPEQHNLDQCEKCSLPSALAKHSLDECIETPETVPEAGHAIQEDEKYPIDELSKGHPLQEDEGYPGELPPGVHQIQEDEEYAAEQLPLGHQIDTDLAIPFAEGIKGHSVQEDNSFLTPSALEQHVIDSCIEGPSEIRPDMHRVSNDQEYTVYAGPNRHLADECATYPGSNQPLALHRPSNDPMYPSYVGPEQHGLDIDSKYPAENPGTLHRGSEDPTYPVYNSPPQHDFAECTLCPLEGRPEGHSVQQCSFYPVYVGTGQHQVDSNPKGPVDLPELHRVSKCSKYWTYEEPEEHSLDSCAEVTPAQKLELHSIQHDVGYPTIAEPGLKRHSIVECPKFQMEHSPTEHELDQCMECPPPATLEHCHPVTECPRRVQFVDRSPHRSRPLGEESGPRQNSENKQDLVIQAPVPISKAHTYPYLTGSVSFSDAEVHGGRVSETMLGTKSPHSGHSFNVGPGTSLRSEHGNIPRESISTGSSRHSQTSVLDYARTKQWVRELLKYPESYTTRLTELPPGRGYSSRRSSQDRRPSESLLPTTEPSRRATGKSGYSNNSGPRIDATIFNRVISDLEKLLNEALALASQVVDLPQGEQREVKGKPSISLHSHCHGHFNGLTDDENSSPDVPVPPSDEESAEDLSDVELGENDRPTRPGYQHAATYSGTPDRPRLSKEMTSYSGPSHSTRAPSDSQGRRQSRAQFSQQATFKVPDRQSSRKSRTQVAVVKPNRKGIELEMPQPACVQGPEVVEEELKSTPAGVIEFTREHTSRQGDRAISRGVIGQHIPLASQSDDEFLPQHDAAGQALHDHDVSLRNRSHVTLPGAQEPLPNKSRKRQPIARD